MNETKIIAVAGKGGVGKTSIAALIVRLLVENNPDAKVLAIDADPAIGLSTALGVEVKCTVDDIRKNFIDNVEEGKSKEAIEILNEAQYQIMDTIVEKDGFAFLAIGRPETAGCYCKVNSFLKDIISTISSQFDYVVIDGEAGIEQVNRRVMESVTHLLLISDPSKKGTNVIQTIERVATGLCMANQTGAIINRLKDEKLKKFINTGDIEILSFIPEDDALAQVDIEGNSLFALDNDTIAMTHLRDALLKIGIL